MSPEVIIGALASALTTVAVTFYAFLIARIKRGEEREEKRDRQFDRLADLIEAALGVKVPRD